MSLARSMLLALAVTTASAARADFVEGYPDVIVCEVWSGKVLLYLTHVTADGGAIYTVGREGVKVGPDRVFRRENAQDCDGKTLEQLREEGKTRSIGK